MNPMSGGPGGTRIDHYQGLTVNVANTEGCRGERRLETVGISSSSMSLSSFF